jgi:hypothetical protein
MIHQGPQPEEADAPQFEGFIPYLFTFLKKQIINIKDSMG